ncbi:MAG TPA: hypothetical protein VGG45_20280 [Terracidiphilus sp.]
MSGAALGISGIIPGETYAYLNEVCVNLDLSRDLVENVVGVSDG